MASTRERLLALVKSEPHLNQTQISERLGVSRQRVSAIATEEGLTLARGPRGVGGRADKYAPPSTTPVTGGLQALPPGTSPAAAVLLTAADLIARGYSVYYPLSSSASADLIAVDRDDRVERISVHRARRAGGALRYDDPDRGRVDRRAFLLTDEPVAYEPKLRGR